jgi:glycosyltransferase involved in cell wall biosynthesis
MRIAMVHPSRESEKAMSGYSITLLDEIKKKGADIHSEDYTLGSPMTLFKKLPRIAGYDVIHIQHEYNLLGFYGIPFFLVFLFLGLFKRGKLITTMHIINSQKENYDGSPIKNFLRRKFYILQNALIRIVSDKIIAHSKFLADILISEYGFKPNQVEVITQGILEHIPKISRTEARKQLGVKGPVYLIIGNFVPDHGADIILKQANKIGKTIYLKVNPKPVNLLKKQKLLGWVKYNQDIIKNNKFGKFVKFDYTDIPSDESIKWWRYFSAADMVLLPYRGNIGSGIFPHSIAAGIPVIASRDRYFKEFSEEYGCVKIAEKDSDFPSVIKEAMKPKNYAQMKKECLRFRNEQGLSVLAGKYNALYLSLYSKASS